MSPKFHVKNVAALSSEKDKKMIIDMLDFAKKSLGPMNSVNARYCFHLPPYNSIDHLHLHAIANLDEMNWLDSIKYSNSSWCFWCQSAESIIASLNNTIDTTKM